MSTELAMNIINTYHTIWRNNFHIICGFCI